MGEMGEKRDELPWVIHAIADHGLFWLHTHGLDKLNLPELEIVDVPSYFLSAGAERINAIGRYMAKTGKAVGADETMQLGEDYLMFTLAQEPPAEYVGEEDKEETKQTHYEGVRLRLDPYFPADCECDECGKPLQEEGEA